MPSQRYPLTLFLSLPSFLPRNSPFSILHSFPNLYVREPRTADSLPDSRYPTASPTNKQKTKENRTGEKRISPVLQIQEKGWMHARKWKGYHASFPQASEKVISEKEKQKDSASEQSRHARAQLNQPLLFCPSTIGFPHFELTQRVPVRPFSPKKACPPGSAAGSPSCSGSSSAATTPWGCP